MKAGSGSLSKQSSQPSAVGLQFFRAPALNTLLLIFIFNFTLQPLVEPDFGWHLRAGMDFLDHGWALPSTDPYSHTMPDWPWVEHAWLTDALIGALYGWAGGLAVILFFGLAAAGAWLFASSRSSAPTFFRRLACVVSLWVALPYLGARTQLVSLLGVSILFCLLDRQTRIGWWWIPVLFFVWANLHGGFTLGLLLLILFAGTAWAARIALVRWPALSHGLDETPLSREQVRRLGLVILASILVTVVNPYGLRLHEEILDSLSNQFMIETLQEWQPVSFATGAGRSYLWYLAGLAIGVLIWYRRFEPVRWVLLSAFLGISLLSMRNIPVFLVLSVPLFAELLATGFGRLIFPLPAALSLRGAWTAGATIAAALLLVWIGPEHLHHVVQSGTRPAQYFRDTSYPIEAVDWIKSNRAMVGTRLYNDYGYGGFLLWWLPEEKIFIDGRMPAWRIGDRRIFQDYVALTAADPPDLGVLGKYGVDWALVRHDTRLDRALERESKWSRPYTDRKASIYVLVRTGEKPDSRLID